MRWDSWRGNPNGERHRVEREDATMLIKKLLHFKGWKFKLHKFINADSPRCFHTHEAWSFRLVLWGGYIEEVEGGKKHTWFPLRFGFVSPMLSHRVARPIFKASYSLWIRSPKTHDIQLRGDGWQPLTETP